MRNNKLKQITTFSQAKRIVQQETQNQIGEIFAECAEDVMQQTIANVLLCLERSCGFGEIRLKRFVKDLQGWNDVMCTPTGLSRTWTTYDNIEYFKTKYGIDLRKEFYAEIQDSDGKFLKKHK